MARRRRTGMPVRVFTLLPGQVETTYNLRLRFARSAAPLLGLSFIPFIVVFVWHFRVGD